MSAAPRADRGDGSDCIGRFAPSPTGPLHAGSLVAALASWLDVRAQGGRWLLRFEDVDTPRCVPGADRTILAQLQACGLVPDEAPVWQSQRQSLYAAALEQLLSSGWAYPCACSRADIERALEAAQMPRPRHGERVYPGTCRGGLGGRPARAVRLRTSALPASDGGTRVGSERSTERSSERGPEYAPASASTVIDWCDRRLGPQRQDVGAEVGDFVLRRADGLWAYQLAVVVDDAAQGVTQVVRGEDLADNTARQIHLQRALGLPTPQYLHLPLVLGADGEKLSKSHGAEAIDVQSPLPALRAAGAVLGLTIDAADVDTWLVQATDAWRQRWTQQAQARR